MSEQALNLPNTLSVIRIFLSPVFAFLFLSDNQTLVTISFFVFTIAALTDWYDGWYARRYGFKTKWGRFLDPLADKVLTSSALICFYLLKQRDTSFFGTNEFIPVGFLIVVIIARDLILTTIRSISEFKGREFGTSFISKMKTFIQMLYIFFVIGIYAFMFLPGISSASTFLYSRWNYFSLLLITVLTIASGIAYIFESKQKSHIT